MSLLQDKDLLPLLDVLATILPKVGEAAAPYATPLLEKALKLCGLQLELLQQQPAQQAQQQPAGQPQPKVPTYDPDALVCALDMVRCFRSWWGRGGKRGGEGRGG